MDEALNGTTAQSGQGQRNACNSTARMAHLLAASAGTATTELLGLHAAGVGNEERAVVADKELAQLQARAGVVELGVVGNEGLGNRLPDSVDLRRVTTTRDADADVDVYADADAAEEDMLIGQRHDLDSESSRRSSDSIES